MVRVVEVVGSIGLVLAFGRAGVFGFPFPRPSSLPSSLCWRGGVRGVLFSFFTYVLTFPFFPSFLLGAE